MKYLLSLLLAGAMITQTQAQDSTKRTIKDVLDAKHFTFEPTNTTTGGGRLKQLTPGYYFKISGDTLKVYLPYYGRAYNAPINSSEIGYDFTSTDFAFEVAPGKKKSYNVTIKTKDKSYNTDFNFSVYDDGTAYLRANSADKQPVSYNGSIRSN